MVSFIGSLPEEKFPLKTPFRLKKTVLECIFRASEKHRRDRLN